jgi:hypothetical protein
MQNREATNDSTAWWLLPSGLRLKWLPGYARVTKDLTF